MRFTHWSWVGACALFCMTACDGQGASPAESVTKAANALSSAPSKSSSSHRIHRSHQDPNARNHSTGRRELDPKDRIGAADGARKVIGVRPTQLLLDRLREEKTTRGGKTGRVSATRPAEPTEAVVPFGDDLVTADAANSERLAVRSVPAELPRAVDNSALPAFPEIRDQGPLDTCVPFAVGYYQYTYALGRLAGWDNKNTSNINKVSPKWLYNLVNNGGDYGTSPYWVHAILKAHGALTWSEFPYEGDTSNPLDYREWPRTAAAWKSALKYKSLGFAWVDTPSTPEGLAKVKGMLANGQVLTFDTYIYSWEFDAIDDDPTTNADDALVGQQIATWMNGYQGSHEATIVGYNDDIWVDINDNGSVDSGEKGAFKIANSWGPDWKNAGYAWIAYDALQWQSPIADAPADSSRAGIMGQVWALAGARVDYQPTLVAEFTASTAARANFGISVGVTESDRSEILSRFDPPAFMHNGGAFAYDGSTTTSAESASFALDLSDLALSYGDVKYVLRGDNDSDIAASISNFTLVDHLKGDSRAKTPDPMRTVEKNGSKAQSVRYKFRDPAHVPRLSLLPSCNLAFGSVPLGQAVERTLTAKNTGTGDLMVTSLRFSNPLFSARTPSSFRLAPGESSTIELEFAPAASQYERALLSVHDTSPDSASALSMIGSATSENDRAPYQLFIGHQNGPQDHFVALRLELKSKVRTSTRLSDYQVVYYLNDPGFDPTTVRWDTKFSNAGSVTASVKQIFLTRQLGVRGANWSVTFRFAPGATLAPGASAVFEGDLHRADDSWSPDETNDWSRYLRRDGMAEGAVIQALGSNAVVFGLPGETAPGAYQLAFSPSEVTTQTEGNVSFTVSDPNQLGSEFTLYIYSSLGELQQTWWSYPGALGARSEVMRLFDQGQSPLQPGKYLVILETGGVRVDATEFTKR